MEFPLMTELFDRRPAALALAVLVPPVAAVFLHLLWTHAPGRLKEWRRSADPPIIDRLVVRLQAALHAEQERRLRILIGTCTAWLLFWALLAHRAHTLAQPYDHKDVLAPLGPIFIFACCISLRPTDHVATHIVILLVIANIAFLCYTVCPQARTRKNTAALRHQHAERAPPSRCNPQAGVELYEEGLRLSWTLPVSPLRYSYLVATFAWLLLNVHRILQLADAAAHLHDRKFVAWYVSKPAPRSPRKVWGPDPAHTAARPLLLSAPCTP